MAEQDLAATAQELGVSYLAADVASKADCEQVAAAAADRLGGIDVLCANAGVFPDARLADITEEDIDHVLGTNLKGTILSVQACLTLLAFGAALHDRPVPLPFLAAPELPARSLAGRTTTSTRG